MLFHVYNPYPNKSVTDYYVGILNEALSKAGFETHQIDELARQDGVGVVTVSPKDSTYARRCGYNPIILWVQGILPEESFMRHKSFIRKLVLSHREIKGLRSADFCIYVSKAMEDHFYRKYHFRAKNNYIMPCFNDEINPDSFFYPNKYSDNVFLYAGGLQTWQCFEETAELFSLVEKKTKNCHLRVLTKDYAKAEQILKNYDVKNYSLGFVPQSEIGNELKKAKFGFSLRRDSPVNRVATPTKLSTYVAHGVIPIYTKALGDFPVIAEGSPYCLKIDLEDLEASADIIARQCTLSFKPEFVLESFTQFFGNYFSKEYHVSNLSNLFNKLIVSK